MRDEMTKPTIRELLNDIENIPSAYELAERVEAVLKLHEYDPGGIDYEPACSCGDLWPCPTIRALDGER